MIAFAFPGQGAQYAGMGKQIAQAFPEATEVFARADAVLGYGLTALCWDGPDDVLRQTEHTQPAILTTSYACLVVLRARGLHPAMTAGLSLGEYTALVCAGAMAFDDALQVVRRRGQLMQEAAAGRRTAMAAILGLDAQTVKRVCREAAVHGVVEPSNFNSPGQVVIAGEERAVQAGMVLAKAAGARRAVVLPVSAPFHTSLMQSAADRLAPLLQQVLLRPARIPVISNVTAEPVQQPEEIRRALMVQVASPVRWEESVQAMTAAGVTMFVEVGPGTSLSGLIRKTAPQATVAHVEDHASLNEAMQILETVTH